MKHKKTLAGALALVMALTACAGGSSSTTEGLYTPGTYTGTARGFGGDVTVEVTVDASSITGLVATGEEETAGIGTNALEQLPDLIVAANGTAVDVVAGATVTSEAIVDATEAALAAARGEEKTAGALSFTAGTYTGEATGYNGPVVLEVTFTEDAIDSIEVIESKETEHVGDSAYPVVFESIIEFTSTGVDGLAGATVTSNAIKAAVEDAAEQAGVDKATLRAGAVPFSYTAGEKIEDTYDVVVIGAGGAGMAAAAEAAMQGATVLVIEKMAEMGGNTLVSGGSYQAVQESLVWDAADPLATEGVFEPTGETVTKVKSDTGRLDTLRQILAWAETPFDETVADASAIGTVDDYDLPGRGVHAEYLDTLLALKDQIRAYIAYADAQMAAGAAETDLTVFSTVELHIFQTYYGGIRLNAEKTEWIYSEFELVRQMCEEAPGIKEWFIQQGGEFDNTVATTLIGCLWQRINRFDGGTINGEKVAGKWGTYFAIPENTLLSANDKNMIMYRTTAKELIIDDSGRVVGVRAEQYDGTEVEITATNGVILATGGYGANIGMVLETNDYWSTDDLTASILTTNRNLAQGEGITMATEVGAAVTGMEFTQLMPLGWVDNGNLAGGNGEDVIYISPAGHENAGRRYVDESAERDVLSQGAYDFGSANGVYIELSNAGSEKFADFNNGVADQDVEGRVYYRDLEGAAELLGIDAAVLEETITSYDAYIIGATDVAPTPAKGGYRATIGTCEQDEDGNWQPETYEIGLLQIRYMAPSTHHTMGGLVIDLDRHVLDENGDVIEGLYAAGEVTGGFFAGNRLGGNAITEIMVSGRVAGESAAQGK